MQNRRDRTGDTDRIRGKSLGLSLFIHCVGIFVLFTSPWNRSVVTTHEVFSVQIIDIPVEILKQTKLEMSPTVTGSVKPEIKTKTPVEKSVTRPFPKVSSFSAEKFREKLSAKIETSKQKEKSSNKNKTTPVKINKIESSVKQANISSLSLTVPQWYISLVQSSIKENWEIYNILGSRSTTVSFRIFRNGRIDNISLEKSSGNSSFDRSVIDAVKETKNLPPFPQEISESYLDIVIDFKTEG
jgi:colicin import membrane protein